MPKNNIQRFSGLFVQYNDGKAFLMEMQKNNPAFRITDFDFIMPIAYPIVFIKVEVLERTMEDFSIVEKTVLRLVKNKIDNPLDIAKMMGLTEAYIQKIIKLLFAYGQIDDEGITELGIQSLKENTSIKMNTVMQKIQVDGLTAFPLDIRSFVNDQTLLNPYESRRNVVHLKPVEGVDTSILEKLIAKNYTDYVNKGELSLHTNAEEVISTEFSEMKYAKAYYMETAKGEVIIMCKAYDSTAKELNEKFLWKPLYVENITLAKKYGMNFTGEIQREAVARITNIKREFSSYRYMEKEKIVEIINHFYKFNWEHTKLEKGKHWILKISKESFDKYDKVILKMLESLACEGADYIILESMYGEYIVVKTCDEELLKIAEYYKERSNLLGRTFVMNSMEKFARKKKCDIFHLLKEVLDAEQDEK